MIIAAFAGVGKTYFCNRVQGAKDLVVMPYKYILPETGGSDIEGEKMKADFSLEMNPGFPDNYIEALLKNADIFEYLLIPSDWRVLAGLRHYKVPYILCYPEPGAKDEYRKRYLQRGNSEDFMDIFIGMWDRFISDLQKDTYGKHIVLTEQEYLLDVKEKIDKTKLPQ
jgi:hypothetical protein